MENIDIKLILIRHGQVPGNIERRFVGITNEALTDEGAEAIRQRAQAKEYPEADLLFISPMFRCIQSANIIYPDLEQIIIDDLREMNFGIFENKNHAELDGNPEYQAWLDAGGREDFPGGEPIGSFCDRVMRGLDEVKRSCVDYAKANNTHSVRAVLVVHGGTIMAILSRLGICDFYDRMFNNGDFRVIDIVM